MAQFESPATLPTGGFSFRLHKGTVPGHVLVEGADTGDVFALEVPSADRSFGFDRDEVQTLVDFLIEVLEETEPGLP